MTGYSESLTYDSIGRPSSQTITTDQSYVIDYAYTSQGLLDTLTYPTSTSSTRVKVKYGYAHGILNSVTDWTSGSAGTVYWTANAQNVRGQTTQETLGNGVVTARSFDAVTGWLNSIQSGLSGGTGLQNLGYAYDLVGNVTQRQENTLGLTENFYYDNLYRLDYSQLGGTTNLDLTYDAMGNITSRSDVNGGASWTYHGTKKHAVATTGSGGTSYSYDANGNMTSRGGATITWASYNYPTGLATGSESTTFYYGPDRQYYRQIYTGPAAPTGYEETHYVGGILEKVYDGITFDWRHYIRAEGQVVAIVSRKSSGANAVHYALEDNQGSGSTLVDAAGTGYVRQSYNAFGLPRDGSDWDGAVPGGDQGAINAITRRGYTGHSMLGAMGLIHMNGRVQDAITGRFLSPDPNIPDPGFTQSYNRYAYVVNNPLSQIDPTGFLNAFLQEVCSSGFHPWAPDMQPNALVEMCFRSMSFWEASESGWLVGMTLRQAAHAGCPSFVMDCDGYHDWLIKTAPARREPIKEPPPDGHVSVGEPGPTYGSPQENLLAVVHRGESATFVAGQEIRMDPYGMALGFEPFAYQVNFHHIDKQGKIVPSIGPPNLPFYSGGAFSSAIGAVPSVTIAVPYHNDELWSGSVQWTVTVPKRQQAHNNNTWGFGVRVYGQSH